MRIENGGKVYESFQEVAMDLYKIKPPKKQTSNKEKLQIQREKFCGKHICPACKQPMQWLKATNIMGCVNPNCKGIKVERKLIDGTSQIKYLPSYDILDDKGSEIATNIFSDLKEN